MKKLCAALASLAFLLPVMAQTAEISTSASACVIIDEESGRVLLSHNADLSLPMASTTKVMTALLALELGDLDDPVVCSDAAYGVPGTSIYLDRGETLTLRDMLYGLMLASGNDAAVAIAVHIGGTTENFCRMMTDRAKELGCTGTVFLTPHGLPMEGHYTTARDLALIAREAMQHPFFREVVSTRRATIPWAGREYDRVLNNKNKLLSTYEGATGIKTGYTRKAGRCLVFGAERDGMRIIGVVLNCYDWFNEAARLMDTAFERYERVTMLSAGETLREVPVTHADASSITAHAALDLTGVVPRGSTVQVELDLPEMLEAPITAGEQIGTARLVVMGETLAETPLVAECAVVRNDLPARFEQLLNHWLLIP